MDEATINLGYGRIGGEILETCIRFLGVPYAAPPVGAHRFAEPQPVTPWDGIRDATRPGATAPQRLRAFPGMDVAPLVGTGWNEGGDYLTLNLWRPLGSATSLPVMVFIHGGGFVIGSKDASVQDGAAFARDGVICIAINYRLGVDGFLPIPGVSTNLGLRDQIAALRWVQANVAAFGGDPANVTVFGESAGAMSIADLIASPLARGLFRRAIVQSGHGAMTRPIPVARRLVAKLAKLLGVTPDRDGFASVEPGSRLLDALETVAKPTTRINLCDAGGHEPAFGISRFLPVHGDDVLPEPPLEALKRGVGAEVDLLIGSNAEEMNLYLVPTGLRAKVGRLLAWIALRKSQPRAWQVLKAYGMGIGRHPGEALGVAMTDLVFRWPARRFAEEHRGRTFVYEFDWRSPRYDGQLGASHGMELPFVFDTLATVTGPEGLVGEAPPQDLATRMHAVWIEFARTGNVPWPEFDRETRQVHRFGSDETVTEPAMPAAAFLP
ncbi:carboxylesterase family protein [Sphingomonas sp.]|uniref:carboxylesterase/lipase family protein n=1 Tax=Sphingomonas sp. TaxID=28214 RepID=UPI001B19E7E7|nr:carboxylesterase family protein [Sphingomonas sp.]MBO9712014.1 carboxylesterase family protein [Sphingomonas sp.]